jgi:hypothetical protein
MFAEAARGGELEGGRITGAEMDVISVYWLWRRVQTVWTDRVFQANWGWYVRKVRRMPAPRHLVLMYVSYEHVNWIAHALSMHRALWKLQRGNCCRYEHDAVLWFTLLRVMVLGDTSEFRWISALWVRKVLNSLHLYTDSELDRRAIHSRTSDFNNYPNEGHEPSSLVRGYVPGTQGSCFASGSVVVSEILTRRSLDFSVWKTEHFCHDVESIWLLVIHSADSIISVVTWVRTGHESIVMAFGNRKICRSVFWYHFHDKEIINRCF